MELKGRIALVTGGAHRVGRALSLALARAGCDVAVHYNSSGDAADRTVRDIEALGRRALPIRADLADAGAAAPLVEEAVLALGGLDLLVNSASIFERAAIAEIDAAAWDRVQAINLRAPFLLSRAAAPHLAHRRGSIINITDLSALQPWPSYAHHAVSKAGLAHLTRVLARALAPDVRVNAIAPGTVLPPEHAPTEDGAHRRLLDVAGTPGDVERALLYLAGSPFVTGQVLVVDGGRTLL